MEDIGNAYPLTISFFKNDDGAKCIPGAGNGRKCK